MSVETSESPAASDQGREPRPTSLTTQTARNLATTTKSEPQMRAISSRWLIRMLPWVEVSGGTYRLNRRLSYRVGDGRVSFVKTGAKVRVIPAALAELPLLRGFSDEAALTALAQRFTQKEFAPGQVVAQAGRKADHVYLVAHGKVEQVGRGGYGEETVLGVLGDGDGLGGHVLAGAGGSWEFTARALVPTTALVLSYSAFKTVAERHPSLRAHVQAADAAEQPAVNDSGEADLAISSGHRGEPTLPGAFADYELQPREYELSVAQTVLRVHSRVADLYRDPMDQTEQQLKLTIEALRERQEYELVNNKEFGLLHNADYDQRVPSRSGPPTPDDLDELLGMRRDTKWMFAHPRAIAAFGRECTKRGVYFSRVEIGGHHLPAWRGVPLLPCGKIPVTRQGTSSILALRTGEGDQGVIGLRQTGLPHEVEPGLNMRFMGVDQQAVVSYLVSTYFSAAVLVPDALGVLEHVEVFRGHGS